MKILLIDHRDGRRERLCGALAHDARYAINGFCQVNGKTNIGAFNGETCSRFLQERAPDVILLHVGKEQRGAVDFLSQTCNEKIVLCYTGATNSNEMTKIKVDCAENPLHCYYPNDFSTSFETSEACNNSTELKKIREFLDSVANYLEKQEANPAEAAQVLRAVKDTLQNFDAKLEAALELLATELSTKLTQGNLLTSEDMEALTTLRDNELGIAQKC